MTPKGRRPRTIARDLAGAIHEAHYELAAASDRLHSESGVTAAMRDVLLMLGTPGEHSVPTIARARGVSRQHIQRVTNSLADLGLVGFVANPYDARTAYVELTDEGSELVAEIERAERLVFSRIARNLDTASLAATTESIHEFAESLRTVATH